MSPSEYSSTIFLCSVKFWYEGTSYQTIGLFNQILAFEHNTGCGPNTCYQNHQVKTDQTKERENVFTKA